MTILVQVRDDEILEMRVRLDRRRDIECAVAESMTEVKLTGQWKGVERDEKVDEIEFAIPVEIRGSRDGAVFVEGDRNPGKLSGRPESPIPKAVHCDDAKAEKARQIEDSITVEITCAWEFDTVGVVPCWRIEKAVATPLQKWQVGAAEDGVDASVTVEVSQRESEDVGPVEVGPGAGKEGLTSEVGSEPADGKPGEKQDHGEQQVTTSHPSTLADETCFTHTLS